jgi:hypothetical protein
VPAVFHGGAAHSRDQNLHKPFCENFYLWRAISYRIVPKLFPTSLTSRLYNLSSSGSSINGEKSWKVRVGSLSG